MFSPRIRRPLGVALVLGLAATGAAAGTVGRPAETRHPGAADLAAWLLVLGMAVPRQRRRAAGAKPGGRSDDADPGRFDALPVQVLEEDFTAIAKVCAELRAQGVTNLVAHLTEHPALARELRGRLRLRDANRPAIAAAGFASKEEMIAGFPGLAVAPYPEVFDHQLVAVWTGRTMDEEEFRYLDAKGRERACLMLQRIGTRDARPDPAKVVLVLLDITTARGTVEEQMENQEVLRQILARANILLWWAQVHRDGGNFRWKINVPSQSYDSPLFRLATARALGGLWDIDHAPDLPEMSVRAEAALRNGSPGYQQEFRVLGPDGTHWVTEDVAIHRLGEDEWNLVCVATDSTARHRAEEAHRVSEARLHQLLTQADCLLWQAGVARAGDDVAWGEFEIPGSLLVTRLFGSGGRRAANTLWTPETAPEWRAMVARSREAILGDAPGYEQTFPVHVPGGDFWLHERVSITPAGPGRWRLSGVIVDATAQHEAEAARRASETHLAQILTRADCLLWYANVNRENGALVWRDFTMPASVLCERLFGATPPDTGTGLWYEADTPDLREMDRRSTQAIVTGAPGYEQEFAVRRPGRTFWLHEQVSITPAGPDRWNLVGILMDVTARRDAEETRKRIEGQLQQILSRVDCVLWHARVVDNRGCLEWSFELPPSALQRQLFGTKAVTGEVELYDQLTVPELPAMCVRSEAALRSGAPGYEQDFRVVKPERTYWLHERVSITPEGPGRWLLFGVMLDVSAVKEAEEARRSSEAQIREILTRADCLLWRSHVVREGDQIRWVDFDVPQSGLYARLFSGPHVAPEGPRRLWGRLDVPEMAQMNERSRRALFSGAPDYEQDFRIIAPGGTIWLHEHVSITPVGPGEWHLVGVVTDLTARREAEQARLEAEARLHQILTRADCLLWQARVKEDAAEALVWTLFIPPSNLYRELFGADPAEQQNLAWSDLKVPELAEMGVRCDRAIRGGAPGYEQEFRARHGDHWMWLHEQVSITRLGPKEWSLVGVITDITARRAAELALAEEKERLAVTLRAMNEGVITTDTHGVVQFVNRAAAELIGGGEAEIVGRPVDEVCVLHAGAVAAATSVPFRQVAAENSLVDLPLRTSLTSRDGTVRQVEGCCLPIHAADSTLIGTVLVFRDIAERERLEQELARASKLESIGILAGGIAHDFNNILTVIMGNLTLAMLDAGELAKVEHYLRESERAALRARDLTQQLLTFAKGGDPIRAAVRLPEVIREVAEFALHGSRIRCEFDFPADLWPADADKGQLGQVVQNLVINSMQAMPEGGVIRISARNEATSRTSQAPFAAGDFVHLAVADTGTGIKAEHLEKIFDPYFTTKQQGSGLGLATVYSIVKKHRGDIEVESELGRGTTFHIWMPARREQQLDLPEERTDTAAPMQGRVLLMDDEQTIRDMVGFLLERLGFAVELAADGAEAVQKFEAARGDGRPFDLVIMDLTVPGGMGGQEAVERLRVIDPEVKAIVSSGYSSDPVLANHRQYGFRGVVAKPYQLDDLVRVLHDVLGPRPAGR